MKLLRKIYVSSLTFVFLLAVLFCCCYQRAALASLLMPHKPSCHQSTTPKPTEQCQCNSQISQFDTVQIQKDILKATVTGSTIELASVVSTLKLPTETIVAFASPPNDDGSALSPLYLKHSVLRL